MASKSASSQPSRQAPSADRVEKMVEILRAHRQTINASDIGTIELHYHRDSLKVKWSRTLPTAPR